MTEAGRAVVERAWVDSIAQRVAQGDWKPVVENVREIRTRLHELLPRRPDLRERVSQSINVDLFGQMAEHDALRPDDFQQYFVAIYDWVQRLGAPVDDEGVREQLRRIQNARPKEYGREVASTLLDVHKRIDVILEHIARLR